MATIDNVTDEQTNATDQHASQQQTGKLGVINNLIGQTNTHCGNKYNQ